MFSLIARMKNERAVTMTEVLIVSVMLIVVMSAVLGVMDASLSNYLFQVRQVDAQDTGRTAMARMTRDIRQAQRPLVQIGRTTYAETLVFRADVDDNGQAETIKYELNRATRIVQRLSDPTGGPSFNPTQFETVADNVVNVYNAAGGDGDEPVFTYYETYPGSPLNPLTDDIINKARVIRIWIKIDEDQSKPPAAVETVTFVKLRNFGY